MGNGAEWDQPDVRILNIERDALVDQPGAAHVYVLMRGCSSSPIHLSPSPPHQSRLQSANDNTRSTQRNSKTGKTYLARRRNPLIPYLTTIDNHLPGHPMSAPRGAPTPPPNPPGREREQGGHHPASLRVKDGEVAPTAPDKARHDDRSCPLPGWHFLPIDPGTFAQSTGGPKGAGRRGEREAARPSLNPSPPAPHRPGDDASPHGRSPMAPARVLLLRRDASTCPHPQGLHAANAAAASRRRHCRPCWRPPFGTPPTLRDVDADDGGGGQ